MIEVIKIFGAMSAIWGGYDLILEDNPNHRKTWSKIMGGIVLILLAAGLNKLGIDF